jgi:hypothetical protein
VDASKLIYSRRHAYCVCRDASINELQQRVMNRSEDLA